MRDILPESYQLAESPELAVLHVLDAALVATEVALVAAYPELEDADHLAEPPPALEADAYVADAVLSDITALHSAVARYVALLRRRSSRQLIKIDGDF